MDKLTTADGLRLHLRHWPAQGASRGTVLIVHGLGEHVGRYTALAGALNQGGWSVAGYHQRGHGVSDGPRGGIAAADSLLDDLARVIDAARAELPGPLVLLGHSMGGLVAARFVSDALTQPPPPWSRPVDALVLSSPALDAGLGRLKKLLLALTHRFAPDKPQSNRLKPRWISRDRNVVRNYRDDRLVHDRISARLARFIVDNGQLVIGRAAQWRTPTLIMWAGADRCVSPKGSAAFVASAPRATVQSREWPRLFHEIFNEPEKREVLAELVAWLDRMLPAPAPAPGPAPAPAPALAPTPSPAPSSSPSPPPSSSPSSSPDDDIH